MEQNIIITQNVHVKIWETYESGMETDTVGKNSLQ